MAFQDRIVERARGCYSCKHFENDKLSRRLWREHRAGMVQHFQQNPVFTDDENPDAARHAMLKKMDTAIANGAFGICLKGKRPADLGGPEGDFVHCAFLCDRWSGKDGSSVATQGKKLDKLPGELHEIADFKAKKR